MNLKKILVVYTIPRTKEQKNSLETVKRILKDMGIKSRFANRDKLEHSQFVGNDLTIAVGGDGTFLRAAQFLKEGKIIGVNADPKNKEGFFLKSNKNNFKKALQDIMDGKKEIKRLSRLEARIDGK